MLSREIENYYKYDEEKNKIGESTTTIMKSLTQSTTKLLTLSPTKEMSTSTVSQQSNEKRQDKEDKYKEAVEKLLENLRIARYRETTKVPTTIKSFPLLPLEQTLGFTAKEKQIRTTQPTPQMTKKTFSTLIKDEKTLGQTKGLIIPTKSQETTPVKTKQFTTIPQTEETILEQTLTEKQIKTTNKQKCQEEINSYKMLIIGIIINILIIFSLLSTMIYCCVMKC
uniref:Uncharacterized protein n=1 Tax=Meloidogyne hapla TaxID=6305 RepID=A0A1I8BX48_MELHA